MDRRELLRLVALAGVGAACVGRVATDGAPVVGPSEPSAAPEPTSSDAASSSPSSPGSPSASPSAESSASPEAASASPAPPTAEPEPEPTATATAPPAPTPEPSPEPSAPTPEPAAAAAGIVVVERICRDAWGARPAGDGMREHTVKRLTVHHSAVKLGSNTNAPTRIRGHQRYHQDSAKWADIAYHLGVDRNGNVYDLRELRFAGDTFTEYDPAGHFLVLAEGDFNQETPSDAQLEVVARTLAWGALEFGVSTDTISGHRDHAGTTCPGDRMYAALPDVRARAADLAKAKGVRSTSLCGDQGRQRVADIEAGRA